MPIYRWFTHWKWWFPIVMLVYQRVNCNPLQTLVTFRSYSRYLKIKYAPPKAPQVFCLCGRSDLYADEGTIPKWFQFRFLIFSRLLRLCLICFPILLVSLFVLSIFPGWWFQTFCLFHFIYGFSSFPLTNSIIFEDGYCTTNQIVIYWIPMDWYWFTSIYPWKTMVLAPPTSFVCPERCFFVDSLWDLSRWPSWELSFNFQTFKHFVRSNAIGCDWNHGILWLFILIGNGKSSQLTFTHIFQRGRYTTNQNCLFSISYMG